MMGSVVVVRRMSPRVLVVAATAAVARVLLLVNGRTTMEVFSFGFGSGTTLMGVLLGCGCGL